MPFIFFRLHCSIVDNLWPVAWKNILIAVILAAYLPNTALTEQIDNILSRPYKFILIQKTD